MLTPHRKIRLELSAPIFSVSPSSPQKRKIPACKGFACDLHRTNESLQFKKMLKYEKDNNLCMHFIKFCERKINSNLVLFFSPVLSKHLNLDSKLVSQV